MEVSEVELKCLYFFLKTQFFLLCAMPRAVQRTPSGINC